MSKRFTLGDYSNGLQELHYDNDFILVEHKNAEKLCNLLNELHNENEDLKQALIHSAFDRWIEYDWK